VKFKSIKGTKDILPAEIEVWQQVESTIRASVQAHGYREIRTPIFEETALFSRSIGESTDIVGKEMYTFKDMGGDSLTLRPEGTASVLRASIQHNLNEELPFNKLYYIGPMFRQEKPQAGRLRQFHQFGLEGLGSKSPTIDAEIILIPMEIYRKLGINELTVKINSVGCPKCRPAYKEKLVAELKKVQDQLSHDSQKRVQNNPLRVLDSKDENDKRLTAHVPLIKDSLCEECNAHFSEVMSLLDQMGCQYEVDGRLVRGLDYYTKTAFEISSNQLGSQDVLAGGGRYDLLAEELGGKPTPGVGFAAGLERLMMVLEKIGYQPSTRHEPSLFIVAADDAARTRAFTMAMNLRNEAIYAEFDYLNRSVKAQMREANRQHAAYVIVLGETELKTERARLKNMASGEDMEVSLTTLSQTLRTHAHN
jgi:histidyl-tRNA synthetase